LVALGSAYASSGGEPLRVVARQVATPTAASTRPHNIKVLINGKRFAIAALVGGADNYLPINAGRLRVEARWQGNARGSGYYVVISTTEPQRRDYKTCSAGTSCLVSQKAQILAGQEMTWTVRIIKTQGKRLAAGFKVCLVGRA